MTDPPTKEQVPTPEEVEREARRLARVRHLTLVRDAPATATIERLVARHDPDPDPRAAA